MIDSSLPIGPRKDNDFMTVYLLALLIGVIAGLRAMTAPSLVSWAT